MINGWRTFCVSIEANRERLRETMTHLMLMGIKAEVFWGVDPNVTGLDWTKWPYLYDNPHSNYHLSPKKIGNHQSLYTLLRVMEYLDGDAFVILEDDARFEEGWGTHLSDTLERLPSHWDLLYFGSCCCDGRPREHIGGRLYKISFALCTHAWVVRKKAIPTILRRCQKVYATLDIALALDCMPMLNCYALLPRIVGQHDTPLPP